MTAHMPMVPAVTGASLPVAESDSVRDATVPSNGTSVAAGTHVLSEVGYFVGVEAHPGLSSAIFTPHIWSRAVPRRTSIDACQGLYSKL